jgi:hypothetical protein
MGEPKIVAATQDGYGHDVTLTDALFRRVRERSSEFDPKLGATPLEAVFENAKLVVEASLEQIAVDAGVMTGPVNIGEEHLGYSIFLPAGEKFGQVVLVLRADESIWADVPNEIKALFGAGGSATFHLKLNEMLARSEQAPVLAKGETVVTTVTPIKEGEQPKHLVDLAAA